MKRVSFKLASIAQWRTIVVIAIWLIAAELMVECIGFLLPLMIPTSMHGYVSPSSVILDWIIWGLGLWLLRKNVSVSENLYFRLFAWFVAVQFFLASYFVVLSIERVAGFDALPNLSPFVGSVVWGIRGTGTVLAILVLMQINRLLDGALATTSGIGVVAVTGAMAVVGTGLDRIFEYSSESIMRELLTLGVLAGFWITEIVFRISMLNLLIRAGRRLKRFVENQQCPRCAYDLRGYSEDGCPECGWRREEAS